MVDWNSYYNSGWTLKSQKQKTVYFINFISYHYHKGTQSNSPSFAPHNVIDFFVNKTERISFRINVYGVCCTWCTCKQTLVYTLKKQKCLISKTTNKNNLHLSLPFIYFVNVVVQLAAALTWTLHNSDVYTWRYYTIFLWMI